MNEMSFTPMIRWLVITSLALLVAAQPACQTSGGVPALNAVDRQAANERAAAIAAEPPGDYWIARRWWTRGTRFWGYVRRPQQKWSDAKLVMMYEGHKHTPDRLPEETSSGASHGFDHNYEYKMWGNFSGAEIYDPNSDMILPEFVLRDYQLISSNPGYLFRPDERYLPTALPPLYPGHGQ